jgi:hypothetical protein
VGVPRVLPATVDAMANPLASEQHDDASFVEAQELNSVSEDGSFLSAHTQEDETSSPPHVEPLRCGNDSSSVSSGQESTAQDALNCADNTRDTRSLTDNASCSDEHKGAGQEPGNQADASPGQDPAAAQVRALNILLWSTTCCVHRFIIIAMPTRQ